MIAETIRAAADVLRAGWSGWAPATDAAGKVCDPGDPDAVAFDCYGAIHRVTGDLGLVCDVIEFLDSCVPCGSLLLWGDDPKRTQAEVVALFTRAWSRASRMQ